MKVTAIDIPGPLALQVTESLQAIYAACNETQLSFLHQQLSDDDIRGALKQTLAVSVFLRQRFIHFPALLIDVLQHPYLLAPVTADYYQGRLAEIQAHDEATLDSHLRYIRQVEIARLILRDVSGLANTEQLMQEHSFFADSCLDYVLTWHSNVLQQQYGQPIGQQSATPQQLIILGMGKLGAYELNLSSDVDLIFAYPEAGETNGPKTLANQQYFTRLGQKIIKSLDKITADGFVFRMDMRLRPFGQSGPLVQSFKAMTQYYTQQGREWERYAMIKARCVAGDKAMGAKLLQQLKPFVFRQYTDFSAIQALREMKALINREVRRLGKQNDVKLGAGGIRELEFIAQSFQLIYGGRDEELQQSCILTILPLLAKRQLIEQSAAEQLQYAYIFLRKVEHAIQAIYDEQTHKLPEDELDLLRVASALGFADNDSFLQELHVYRQIVRSEFEQLVEQAQSDDIDELGDWQQIWHGNEAVLKKNLIEQGFSSQEIELLLHLRQSSKVARLEEVARQRFDSFMPRLLNELITLKEREDAVQGLIQLIEAVLRRTVYLVLLNENPQALKRLVAIAAASPWIIQQLARQPVLLDELLDDRGLGQVPAVEELRESLRVQGLRLPVEDQEAHMQMLRYFRLSHHLHIVAAEISGKLPLMKVSDYLTFLAEAILEYVLHLAWLQAVARYGYPTRAGEPCDKPEFLIVGYGKLGGIELSHQSDLDLIFLHNADTEGMTDGEKSVANVMFYTRMGQFVIHQLTTRTVLGQLYEVDTRLRPSGESGLLVNSLDAFWRYQQNRAWTWEHQALVRARAITGSKQLAADFAMVRANILTQARDLQELRQQVVNMREKMYQHLAPHYVKNEQAEIFDLKHSRGGIVDLEFMVQFAVLAWSHQHPAIAYYSDNIRILENLSKAGLLSQQNAQALIEIYRFYRSQVHRLALRQEKGEVLLEQVQQQRGVVLSLWQQLLGKT